MHSIRSAGRCLSWCSAARPETAHSVGGPLTGRSLAGYSSTMPSSTHTAGGTAGTYGVYR